MDPWQHATQLEFTFKFPAVRLHTAFLPFASLISTVHLSFEGMEKKKGRRDFVRLMTKFDIALHRSVSVLMRKILFESMI